MKLLLASAGLAVVLTSAAYAQIPSSLQACPAATQYTMAGAKPAEGDGATHGPQLASAEGTPSDAAEKLPNGGEAFERRGADAGRDVLRPSAIIG